MIQVQGVHHITIHGSTRQSAIDFWEGLLGMPFVMEQPNLGKPDENHLYFDPGDGRLITVFTKEDREDDGLLVELSSYKFEAPEGISETEVLMKAHALRGEAGAGNISDEHFADLDALDQGEEALANPLSRQL